MASTDTEFKIAVSEADGEQLASEVLDGARKRPIVCLSSRSGEDDPAFDPEAVRRVVGDRAILRGVRTGAASRYLDDLLPEHFGVFGGAARIWWPGVDEYDDPRRHPLVLDKQGRYGTRALEILAEGFDAGPPPYDKRRRDRMRAPRAAEPERLVGLAIPDAVVRDRTRAHHLLIVAAWLARDHDAGRRDRPMGPLAIGEHYLASLGAVRDRLDATEMAVLAARIASGKPGEADDLRVVAEVDEDGTQVLRDEDDALGWSCRIPEVQGGRLRWWTREDGAVELRDVVVP
ncbi:MAG: hypothetical protein WC558_06055 [Patulibacter sp.]